MISQAASTTTTPRGKPAEGGGWFSIPNSLLPRMWEVGSAALCVFLVLRSHANSESRCWPGQLRIAQMLHRTPRAVQASIQRLVQAGWISIDKAASRRDKRRGNTYLILEVPPNATSAGFFASEEDAKKTAPQTRRKLRPE